MDQTQTPVGRPAVSRPASSERVGWTGLGVIALGGGLGGLARYALGVWAPTLPGSFPVTTFAINVSGCALIGCLMVVCTELLPHRVLPRLFLGVGVLGGYTTFSLHVLEVQQLLAYPAVATAVLYLAGTVVAAITAVATGMAVTRWLIRLARRRRSA